MNAHTTSYGVQELTPCQLKNIIGGEIVANGPTPTASTGYSILLSDGTIVPNTGWLGLIPDYI